MWWMRREEVGWRQKLLENEPDTVVAVAAVAGACLRMLHPSGQFRLLRLVVEGSFHDGRAFRALEGRRDCRREACN